jgi:hypothetical protein
MYAISFVVLAMFWLGHHMQFRFVRRVDRPLLWINLAFLLLAVVVPFSTNLVGDHGHLQLPAVLYAVNLLALTVLLFLQLRHLAARPHLIARQPGRPQPDGRTSVVGGLLETDCGHWAGAGEWRSPARSGHLRLFLPSARARSGTVSKNANSDRRARTRGIGLDSTPFRPNG